MGFLGICLVVLMSSCSDYCPGIPRDFEEGTEQRLPHTYAFRYAGYKECWAILQLKNDTSKVRLALSDNGVVTDTSFYDICEDGYYYLDEKHFVVFKNHEDSIELRAVFCSTDIFQTDLTISGVFDQRELPFSAVSETAFLDYQNGFSYTANPSEHVDTLVNGETNETILFRFFR